MSASFYAEDDGAVPGGCKVDSREFFGYTYISVRLDCQNVSLERRSE